MRTHSRRIHWSYRRLLLAACLCGPTFAYSSVHCAAAETPANQIRIVTTPANQPPAGQVQLASDGWGPRGGSDTTEKTSGAVVATGNEERVGSGSVQSKASSDKKIELDGAASNAALELNEPKSTLNFILPSIKRADEKPVSPPAAKPQAVAGTTSDSLQPSRLASELYGPGIHPVVEKQRVSDEPIQEGSHAVPEKQKPIASSTVADLPVEAGVQSKALKSEDRPTTKDDVANPEQNEPYYEPDATKELVELESSDAESSSANEGGMELVPYDSTEPEPIPQRLEVRELKLGRDGSLSEQERAAASDRKLAADPISARRSDSSRQSITDGEEPAATDQAIHARDTINSAGELKLSLGLPEQIAISATAARLRAPIERTLSYYWARPENTVERTHWGMFHQMMIYDKDTQIIYQKQQYNAVAWMAGNNPCRNQLLYDRDEHGIVVKEGIGLQGHQAQMLAVFGLVDVPANYPIYVSKQKYSVNDVIQREMKACKSGAELTFTLIGLSHYIDTDSKWTSFDGEKWTFDRLIQEELAQPIVGAACGGTHRLMGFAHALRRRRAEGKPITGQWARADKYVRDFIDYTWQLQNRDGSMSTEWFEKQEDNGKIDRKVQTTGHMVEFLLTALNDDELQSPQMLRSMSFLTNSFWEERGHDWQVGPKGHALRALVLYYQRVYGRPDPWRSQSVATRNSRTAR